MSELGEYQSLIPSPELRFAASLGELITGRVSMIGGANQMAKLGLTIAVRYGAQRRQFGGDGHGGGGAAAETPVLHYAIHQVRSMPYAAAAVRGAGRQ